MGSYPAWLPHWQFVRLSLSFSLLACVCWSLPAQHRLMVPNPFDPGAKLEVLALESGLCWVDLGSGVERVAANSYFFEEASSYAEGFLEINRPSGNIIEDRRKMTFEFNTKVKPSRDYEDCFLVLQLFTQDGREYLLPSEIDDLQAGKEQRVHISPQLAFRDLKRGVYRYHFFSAGDEIYFAPTAFELGKKRQRPLSLKNSGSREPQLVVAPVLLVPRDSPWVASEQEVLLAVGVNDSGYSVDHTLLSEPGPSLRRSALDLVKNARFTPGSEDGFFARKDLLLRVRFDASGRALLSAVR